MSTIICEKCKFGSELPIKQWVSSHNTKKCNENIACYKKYDSQNVSFEEIPSRELECPKCSQKCLGTKGIVTHYRNAHADDYLPWRTNIGNLLTVQCDICKFCFPAQPDLDTHMKKEFGCKKNIEMQKVS